MARPNQPSWNAGTEAWVAYAAEFGIEVPDDIPSHRDRIRRFVLEAVEFVEVDESDDDEPAGEPSDEPKSDDDEPAGEPSDEPKSDDEDDVPEPARNGSHSAWVEYAVSKGADASEAVKLTRDDLIAAFGS